MASADRAARQPALGVPVRIGTSRCARAAGCPRSSCATWCCSTPPGATALRLPRVVAALSPRSLLALELRFEQLLIDGAELEIRRDAQGRIFVAGLDLGGAAPAATTARAADWFFKQREFVIRGGALRWTDEQRPARRRSR